MAILTPSPYSPLDSVTIPSAPSPYLRLFIVGIDGPPRRVQTFTRKSNKGWDMGGKAGARNPSIRACLFAFFFLIWVFFTVSCGSGQGTDSGLSPGADNVSIMGVISSSVMAPEGLAQTVDAGSCGEENFVCTVTFSGTDGEVLSTEQVIVSILTCQGRPVNGSTLEMGSFSVSGDAAGGGFTIDVECLVSGANLLDGFINNFSGSVIAVLGADGTVSVVLTLSNLFDFATSAEAMALLQTLGCPALLGLDLLLGVFCEEDAAEEPTPPTKAPPATPAKTLVIKNGETQPSEDFICDTFRGLVQEALDSSFCVVCGEECEADADCGTAGFVCDGESNCCKCAASCAEGASCKAGSECNTKTSCCEPASGECDQPCNINSPGCPPGPSKLPQTCNFDENCCEDDSCADCQKGVCPSGQECVKECCNPIIEPVCGDRKLTPPEVCDNTPVTFCGCHNDCHSCCGNGIVEVGEFCDPLHDGPSVCTVPGESCAGHCQSCCISCEKDSCPGDQICGPGGCCVPAGTPICGNGVIEGAEECEFGLGGVIGCAPGVLCKEPDFIPREGDCTCDPLAAPVCGDCQITGGEGCDTCRGGPPCETTSCKPDCSGCF